jgi:hypothetical protein
MKLRPTTTLRRKAAGVERVEAVTPLSTLHSRPLADATPVETEPWLISPPLVYSHSAGARGTVTGMERRRHFLVLFPAQGDQRAAEAQGGTA